MIGLIETAGTPREAVDLGALVDSIFRQVIAW